MGDVTSRDVDRGWAWVVLVASVLILSSLSVFNTTIGIFQVEFLESFHGSQGLVALIGSISLSSQFLYGPFVGILSDLFTHRVTVMVGAALVSVGLVSASFSQNLLTLLVLFGIVCGLGGGLCYTPTITVVSTYFYKYRTLVNGICLAAPGVGLLVAPYLAGWLIEEYGWRFAMVCYGCGMAQMCVLASFFFPHDTCMLPSCCTAPPRQADSSGPEVSLTPSVQNGGPKVGQKADASVTVGSGSMLKMSEYGSSLMMSHCSVAWSVEDIKSQKIRQKVKRVLKDRFLWLMSINQLLLMAGFSVTYILFPAYAQGVGLNVEDIPPIYILYGVTVTLSRVISGVVFSFIPDHLLKGMFCVQLGYAAVLTLMPLLPSTFTSVMICKMFIGLTYGPSFGLIAPILVRYFGLSDLPLAFGIVTLASGVGCAIAPPISGVLYDIIGNYRVCFYVAGCTIGAAALSLLLLFFMRDRQPLEERRLGERSVVSSKQREVLLPTSQVDPGSPALETAPDSPCEKPRDLIHTVDNEEALFELFRNRHG